MSTPQDIALKDAVRGVEMFRKVNVPVSMCRLVACWRVALMTTYQIMGMIQNMSAFTCPTCQSTHSIFGTEGVTKKCDELGIKLLGDIPLHPSICENADKGKPTVVAEPDSVRAKVFSDIANSLRELLDF